MGFNRFLNWGYFFVLIGAIGYFYYCRVEIGKLKYDNEILYNNNKAYEYEINNLYGQVGVYKISLLAVNRSRDSLVLELNKVRKELGIKDSEIRQMIGIRSSLRDTAILVVGDYFQRLHMMGLDGGYSVPSSTYSVFTPFPASSLSAPPPTPSRGGELAVCDFERVVEFNEYTKVFVCLRDSLLMVVPDFSDRLLIYDLSRKQWKESSFFRRVFLFKWGKYTVDEFRFVNENELNKITDFKVIRVVE